MTDPDAPPRGLRGRATTLAGRAPARSVLAGVLVLTLTGCGGDDARQAGTDDEGRSTIIVPADAAFGEDFEGSPDRPGALQRALAETRGPATLELQPGHHRVASVEFVDLACGNCQDPEESVPGTVGLLVGGRDLHLTGTHPDSVIIHTNAGYGIFFEGCHGCSIEGVTVTGGVRDPDDRATNGAIVARDASLRIGECRIVDNVGDSATVASTVVGIAGIVGREGSRLTVEGCRIMRNSWDGIALYRGARAEIRDNVIDGVDLATGAQIGGGRGVGIGLTWNARADVEGNLVRRYWKGIGVFVDAQADVRHNVVEEIRTWGLSHWAAGEGSARARFHENVVFETGACGAMLSPSAAAASPGADASSDIGRIEGPGSFTGNALIRTAGDEVYDSGEPYCTQVPIARGDLPEGYRLEDNLLHDNRFPGAETPPDQLSEEAVRAALGPMMEQIAASRAMTGSSFLTGWWRR